jgi:cytochrome c peroxidase
MHDGSIATLEGVVAYYNEGGTPHDLQASQLRPLGLSEDERAELVAFLRALTDPALEHADWASIPWADGTGDSPQGRAAFAAGAR